MEPFSRMVSELPIESLGHDMRAVQGKILGGATQNTLVHKAFREYLVEQNMIRVGRIPLIYHFSSPWNTSKLSRLGIRYVITGYKSDELLSQGWKVIGQEYGMFLYENPKAVSLVYIQTPDNKVDFLRNVTLEGNGLIVELPSLTEEVELVATFLFYPGWQAKVDGVGREIYSKDNQFIRIRARPGDKNLVLTFAPYNSWSFVSGIVLSILILCMIGLVLKKKIK